MLYGVARVLHDREDYHDALHMYHRALKLQRTLVAEGGRPSLDIIKTLCNISRVHHLSGEIDAALGANREVMDLALLLLDGKMEHPFLIHRLKKYTIGIWYYNIYFLYDDENNLSIFSTSMHSLRFATSRNVLCSLVSHRSIHLVLLHARVADYLTRLLFCCSTWRSTWQITSLSLEYSR